MTASKIESELMDVLKLKGKKGEKRSDLLIRILKGVTDLTDEDFDALSKGAQDWANAASKAKDAQKDLPDFPDANDGAEGAKENEVKKQTKTSAKAEKPAKAEKAPKAEKAEKAPKAPKAEKKAGAGRGVKGDGYKGHRVGSNKEQVHKLYDEKGADAAIKLAAKLGLSEGTPKSWISSWGGGAGRGRGKKAEAAKK